MLTNEERNKPLYKEIEPLMDSLKLELVEVNLSQVGKKVTLRITLYDKEKEITTKELEEAYNILYPRYSVLYHDRDLEMEVTSPGLQRNFKDYIEFEIFKGKLVRVYSTLYSSYVVGEIGKVENDTVELLNYNIEDKKESGISIKLNFSDIAKAKLEYKWETKHA